MATSPSFRNAYGVDLSGERLLVCRGAAAKRSAFELAADIDRRAPSPADVEILARIRAEAEAGRAVVAACLPLHDSFARWLQAPFPSIKKTRKVLPSLLDVRLPFPLERCVFDLPVLQRLPDGRSEALAAAALAEGVASFLERLREGGIDPEIVDHEGLALWTQALAEKPPSPGALRVVVYLGEDHTALVIGRGERFLSAHAIRAGSRELAEPRRAGDDGKRAAALKNLGLKMHQVVLSQMPEEERERAAWLWTGPGADQAALIQDIRRAAGLPDATMPAVLRDPAWFLARACAARALARGPLPCNLRTGSLVHPRVAGRREAAGRRAVAACLAAGLALCAVNSAWLIALDRRKQSLQDRLSAVAHELAQSARVPRGQEVTVAERAVAERRLAIAPFVESFSPSPATLLSDMLQVCRQNGLELGSADLQRGSVELAGSAADWKSCEVLSRFLAGQGWLASEPERSDAGADERVHFVVRASRP
jgi:hypothetical protein